MALTPHVSVSLAQIQLRLYVQVSTALGREEFQVCSEVRPCTAKGQHQRRYCCRCQCCWCQCCWCQCCRCQCCRCQYCWCQCCWYPHCRIAQVCPCPADLPPLLRAPAPPLLRAPAPPLALLLALQQDPTPPHTSLLARSKSAEAYIWLAAFVHWIQQLSMDRVCCRIPRSARHSLGA
jgi:hypothetical protein